MIELITEEENFIPMYVGMIPTILTFSKEHEDVRLTPEDRRRIYEFLDEE